MMRVSAGIVRYPDGRILICRRGEGRKNAHLWEFPGGKQEAGESPEDALRRELLEELSLPIADVSPLCRREAQGIAFDFLTATATRAPVLTEHEGYALVYPAEMTKYVFCPADEVVARQIAFANVRACLWDFDGTLMDTYPPADGGVRAHRGGKRGASDSGKRAFAAERHAAGCVRGAVGADGCFCG